jgi:SAM-dependent methyltransferase
MSYLDKTRRKCREIRERSFIAGRRPVDELRGLLARCGGPTKVLLDLGCGRAATVLRAQAANFKSAYGVDMEIAEPIHEGNLTLLPADAAHIPLPPASVDVIISINVLEHLADPEAVLEECHRVLRPGGHVIILTPNKHYPPLALARVLPHRVRVWLNRLLTGTQDDDTFPAPYRANCPAALARMADGADLAGLSIEYVMDHPHYLMFSTWAYRLGMLLERAIMSAGALRFLRHSLVCHFQKPAAVGARRRQRPLAKLAK